MIFTVDPSEGLPGGLGVWRGRWLLGRHSGALAVSVWTVFLAVTFPPFLAFVAVQLLVDRYRRRGAPVTGISQPGVDALVAGVASRLGVPLPDRVWLTAEPIVRATVAAGRSHLSVGLPLVECLAPAEVAALVGHELALLRRPRARLVIGLLARWAEAVREESFQDGRELRRATAVRTPLDAMPGS